MGKLNPDAAEHWSLVGNHGSEEKYLSALSIDLKSKVFGPHDFPEPLMFKEPRLAEEARQAAMAAEQARLDAFKVKRMR
jgi:hypothetical protein